jgi:hypothetical protein
MLKIPRHHMIFLKENGKLDDFIDAKMEGDDLTAKWCLLETADKEIKEIQKENEVKNQPTRIK